MTTFNVIHSKNAPQAIGCYSQAIKLNNFIFLSGQLGLDPITQQLPAGFLPQLHQALKNIQAILEEANANLSHIVKLTVYLQNLSDFSLLNETMKTFFVEPYPCRTVMEVSALPKDALVELDTIAVI